MKKRILSMALVLCMMLGILPITMLESQASTVTEAQPIETGVLSTDFGGGTGTKDDPYIIATQTQFESIADRVNGNPSESFEDDYFRVELDSTTTSLVSTTPIGKSTTAAFKGYFDGNNCTIALDQSVDNITNYGIFGYVSGGVVTNINATNLVVGTTAKGVILSTGISYGSVTGSSIQNFSSTNILKTNSDYYVGSVVGVNDGGVVMNCTNDATVSATFTVTTGTYTYTYTPLTGTGYTASYAINGSAQTYAGGIVGYNTGTVFNCYNNGAVTSQATATMTTSSGGTTGYNDEAFTTVANTYAHAGAGGIVGYNTGKVYNS